MSKKNRKAKKAQKALQNLKLTDVEAWREIFGWTANPSGRSVTVDSAMQSSAVYACVRLIAGAIASLPVGVFLWTPDGPEARRRHPVDSIISFNPNPLMSAMVFWEAVLYWLLLTGNSYSLIGRNGGGNILSLTPLVTSRVSPKLVDGRLLYAVTLDNGEYVVFDQDDILHIPGLGWDGVKGMSVLRHAATTIGSHLAQTEYAARFFSNGARPDGVIHYDKKMNKDQADMLREYWAEKHQGVENAHLPAVLTEGGKYQAISMTAEESQMIESRRLSVADIARLYGVPPHMIGETDKSTAWGSGLEEMSTGFVIYSLRPVIKRIEQEIGRKLLRSRLFYAEFNLTGLLRGDTKSRHEAYKVSLGGNMQPGFMSVNEVRKLENLAPLAGDEYDKPYKPPENTGMGNANEEQVDAAVQPESRLH